MEIPTARLRRWGMTGRLVAPVVLVFVAFTGALGFWISRLSRDTFLAVAKEQTVTLELAARAYLRAEWARFAQQLGNPVINQRLAPLVTGQNVDAVSRALRGVSQTVEADFIHAYTAKMEFLASSRETQSVVEPAFLAALARSLAHVRQNSVYLVTLPPEALTFEGLDDVRPRPATGEALAVVAAVPITDNFGERLGVLLAFRLLNGNDSLVRELATLTGGQYTLLHRGTRIATTLKAQDGRSLAGTRLPPGSPVLSGRFRGSQSVGGQVFESRCAGLLAGPMQAGSVALSVSVPVSGFLARADNIRRHVLGAGLLAIALGTPLLVVVVRRSVRAVGTLLTHMNSVADGHLGARVSIDTSDELEALADGINETVSRLSNLVSNVDATFAEVEAVSELLAATADSLGTGASWETEVVQSLDEATASLFLVVDQVGGETHALQDATQDILGSLQGLSTSFSEMAGGAAEVAGSSAGVGSAIEEMSANISQTATNVSNLSEIIGTSAAATSQIDRAVNEIDGLSAKAREVAQRLSLVASVTGRGAMERARIGMADTRRLISAWGETVQNVGKRSLEIGEVTSLISGVADQTKLLALNASILASQAGEHGRGFAVVAGQIRQLSEKTNTSAKTIARLIQAIQEESRLAVEEAERGKESAESSTAEVDRMAEALERIIAGVADTGNLMEQIADQTKRQSISSSEVAESLIEVASMSQQLAASAQEQDVTGREILQLAEVMGQKADDMQEATAQQATGVASVVERVSAAAAVSDRLTQSAAATARATMLVRESTEVIRDVVKQNQDRVVSLRESIQRLCTQSEQVREGLSSFNLR